MQQGSDEWHQIRLGIPTASRFDQIITPKTLELSASSTAYIIELVTETMIGEPCDTRKSEWMERGTGHELQAAHWYEITRDTDAVEVGFVSDDALTYGCSPDRLVGDDGALEIKVPGAKKHMEYLLNPAKLAAEYRHQVQGGLWVCRETIAWWDIMSYHPTLPRVVYRCVPDPQWFEKFGEAFPEFLKNLADVREQAKAKGCIPWLESDAYKMQQESIRREAEREEERSTEVYA